MSQVTMVHWLESSTTTIERIRGSFVSLFIYRRHGIEKIWSRRRYGNGITWFPLYVGQNANGFLIEDDAGIIHQQQFDGNLFLEHSSDPKMMELDLTNLYIPMKVSDFVINWSKEGF
jgi:hypothetical protein